MFHIDLEVNVHDFSKPWSSFEPSVFDVGAEHA